MKKLLLTMPFLLAAVIVFAQPRVISGVVKGSGGETLPGVNIVEKGTQNGVITNQNGEFTLKLTSADAMLVFSYVGYISQEIDVKNRQDFNIVMSEDLIDLDEVVVVGYGTSKKGTLTGSITTVKPRELNLGAISNAAQMLQGRVTGLYVSSHNQDPGATPEFVLRGASSFQQGEAGQPLIVIDGFPMENASFINTINPNDIQQIDVLKDASATSIYGSRGANGVIIITTKQGNKDGIQIDYSAKLFSQAVARTMEVMNAEQYARFYYDLAHDPNLQLGSWGPDNGYPHPFGTWDTLPNTNWQKEVINRGNLTQEHNLAISGVKEGVKYRAGAGYYDGDGMLRPSNYKRINTLAKIDYEFKKFSFSLDVNYTNENRQLVQNTFETSDQGQNSYERALGFSPSSPVYDEDGNLSLHAFEPNATWYYNPLFQEQAEEKFSETNTIRIAGGAEYEILKGLRASIKGGITQSSYEEYFQRFKPLYESQKETEASAHTNTSRQIYADYFLKYTKQINDHNFSVMVGGSLQNYRERGLWTSAVDFPYINIGYYNINAGLLERQMGSSWYEKRVISGLGRINYDFKNKYLLTVNYRLDGATVFGEDNKWGQFPSFSLAYRLDQENFFKERFRFLSIVKLRAGYGIAGNANIPGFRTQNLINFRPVHEGGGISNAIIWGSTYLPNPELHWENSYTTNLGLEVGNPVFYTELNVYLKNHHDLILDRQVPTELGYTNITVNKGQMTNKGIEAKVNLFLDFFNGRLKWNPGIWFSYNKNTITDLDGDVILDKDIWIERTSYGYAGIKQKGYPLNAIWGYDFVGIWQENEREMAATYNAQPGDPKFADINGTDANGNKTKGPDGKITEDDRIFLGDANPRLTSGFSSLLTYKKFELSVFFEGVFDKAIVNVNKATFTFPSYRYGNNKAVRALDRWTPSNPSNETPSLTKNLTEQMIRSDWSIEDGSFIRLRDLTLSYKLFFNESSIIKNLMFFGSASNLFTLTRYSGINPDVWATDEEYNLMPFTRVFTLGINASF
jgi:TonB-dependent starch-binding outer membrane protein SusC